MNPSSTVPVARVVSVPPAPSASQTKLGAILTDIHFWVPVVVLGFGLALLMVLS